MLEALSGLLSTLRQTSPALFLGLAIASGIIIFIGDETAARLGLDDFRTVYRAQLGGMFIVSLSVIAAQALWRGGRLVASAVTGLLKRLNSRAALKQRQTELRELTPDEKAYLAPYILYGENTQYFQLEDGVAGGLEAKGIIYKASNMGSILTGWAYNMQPWARKYLKEHPELLKCPNPNPSGPPLT